MTAEIKVVNNDKLVEVANLRGITAVQLHLPPQAITSYDAVQFLPGVGYVFAGDIRLAIDGERIEYVRFEE